MIALITNDQKLLSDIVEEIERLACALYDRQPIDAFRLVVRRYQGSTWHASVFFDTEQAHKSVGTGAGHAVAELVLDLRHLLKERIKASVRALEGDE